jgi:hypothetical protein
MKSRFMTAVKQTSLAQSHLISSIQTLFRHDERLCKLMFHHQERRLRATPEEILKESRCLSRGERILVKIGLDLWSDSGSARVSDIVEHLDDDNVMAFIRAILRCREMDLYVTLEEEPSCFD